MLSTLHLYNDQCVQVFLFFYVNVSVNPQQDVYLQADTQKEVLAFTDINCDNTTWKK